MKVQTINKAKTEVYRENIENFKFYWIFLPDGYSIQKHDEAEYNSFLDRNYISKSNIDLEISF